MLSANWGIVQLVAIFYHLKLIVIIATISKMIFLITLKVAMTWVYSFLIVHTLLIAVLGG